MARVYIGVEGGSRAYFLLGATLARCLSAARPTVLLVIPGVRRRFPAKASEGRRPGRARSLRDLSGDAGAGAGCRATPPSEGELVGKREWASQVYCRLGLNAAVRVWRARRACHIPILAYHRVRSHSLTLPFDLELVSATPEQFRRQMQYVRRHYTSIAFADLVAHLDEGAPLPRNPILVTFDDGFIDNFGEAYPILLDTGVRATFFVSTGYVGQPGTFWFDEVCHMLLETDAVMVTLPGGPSVSLLDRPSRRAAGEAVLSAMKGVRNEIRLRWIEALREQTGVRLLERGHPDSSTMNWDQVREMVSGGMEIGSHTVTHPILSNLSGPQLDRELQEARETIARETGMVPVALAYPVGSPEMTTTTVREAVKRAGYGVAVAYYPGVNRLGSLDRYDLRRIAVERYVSDALFRSSISLPEFFLTAALAGHHGGGSVQASRAFS